MKRRLRPVRGVVMGTDGEMVGEAGHGRSRTRHAERDTNGGRSAR